MMLIQWRIYYGDGSTFDDQNGALDAAPGLGVIAVLHQAPCWSLWYDKDWYWFRDGEWFGGDLTGLLDHLIYYRELTLVFMGRVIRDLDYRHILENAKQERDRLSGKTRES